MKANVNKERINSFLDEKKVTGLIRIGIVSFLNYTKIGQNVLLQQVFENKKDQDLVNILQKAEGSTKEEYIKTLDEKAMKEKGFYSPVSMANFSFQLPADQRQILITVLQDQEGRKILQDTVKDLMNNYVYTS